MKIATTKQRILQYIDFKSISLSNFLAETDIKRGFLDSDKLESSVSDVFIAKIIAKYNDLNLYWLITGKGEMLRNVSIKKEEMGENAEIVALLKQQIEDLKADKERLYKLLESKEGNQKTA